MKRFLRCSLAVMAFAFACSLTASAQLPQWQDMHKVKKGETVFGIAKEYNISIEQLLDANPEMKEPGYELKKGTWVRVPFQKDGDKNAKDVKEKKKDKKNKTAQPAEVVPTVKKVRVGVMLPLHNVDGDGRRMVEYYRGLLMAINELRKEGIHTEVYTWNVPKEADIRTTLLDANAEKVDIIFGPLYTPMVQPLAGFCKTHNIKMVIPFSINGDDVATNPQIFQVYQEPNILLGKSIAAYLERFPNYHPVFIDCKDDKSDKGPYTAGLRKQLDLKAVEYNVTSIETPAANFAKAFSTTKPNVVVLNSANSPQLNKVFAKLDALKKTNPALKITLYGYTEWLMYQKYDQAKFYEYDVYIPTYFYYNPNADRTEAVEKAYKESFKETMMEQYLPRFALTGYDHGMYFVRGVSQFGKDFVGSPAQSTYRPLQTRLSFERVGTGGYKNGHFQLIHFLPNQTMEAITY